MFRDPFVEFAALLLLTLAGDDDDGAVGPDLIAGDRHGRLVRLLGHADERRLAPPRLARRALNGPPPLDPRPKIVGLELVVADALFVPLAHWPPSTEFCSMGSGPVPPPLPVSSRRS